MKKYILPLLLTFILAGCSNNGAEHVKKDTEKKDQTMQSQMNEESIDSLNLESGTYAVINTQKGRIIAKLYEDLTPVTTANFIGLAEGTKEWTDPATGELKKEPFYNGLTFMRIIPGFMIQGGDPLNNTTGGPGYRFQDEFVPSLKFDKPGLLAMANAGPNTNGSQFFITDMPRGRFNDYPVHLNGRHTIFGEVVDGMTVVSLIADSAATSSGLALTPIKINTVEILRIK